MNPQEHRANPVGMACVWSQLVLGLLASLQVRVCTETVYAAVTHVFTFSYITMSRKLKFSIFQHSSWWHSCHFRILSFFLQLVLSCPFDKNQSLSVLESYLLHLYSLFALRPSHNTTCLSFTVALWWLKQYKDGTTHTQALASMSFY